MAAHSLDLEVQAKPEVPKHRTTSQAQACAEMARWGGPVGHRAATCRMRDCRCVTPPPSSPRQASLAHQARARALAEASTWTLQS